MRDIYPTPWRGLIPSYQPWVTELNLTEREGGGGGPHYPLQCDLPPSFPAFLHTSALLVLPSLASSSCPSPFPCLLLPLPLPLPLPSFLTHTSNVLSNLFSRHLSLQFGPPNQPTSAPLYSLLFSYLLALFLSLCLSFSFMVLSLFLIHGIIFSVPFLFSLPPSTSHLVRLSVLLPLSYLSLRPIFTFRYPFSSPPSPLFPPTIPPTIRPFEGRLLPHSSPSPHSHAGLLYLFSFLLPSPRSLFWSLVFFFLSFF